MSTALVLLGVGAGMGIGLTMRGPVLPIPVTAASHEGISVPLTNEARARRARSERALAAREFALHGSVESAAASRDESRAGGSAARIADPNPPPAHAEFGPEPTPVPTRATNVAASDGGVGGGASAVLVTPPAVLAEARSTIDRALTRRTLSGVDRARLLTLLPSMAEADRIVLATRVFEAATSGALAIESTRPAPATDVPLHR